VIAYQNIINRIFAKTVLLCLFTLVALVAIADDEWNIKVNGRVTDDQAKIEGAVVSLIKNSRLMQEVITAGNGKFVFVLRPGADYLIEVAKPGYATKSISFSTKNVPIEKVGAGFPDFPIEIRLFQEVDGVNMEVLDHPVGKIVYSPEADDFKIDMKYHQSVKAELAQLSKDMKAAKSKARKEERLGVEETLEQELLVDNEVKQYTTPTGVSGNSVIPEIVVEANNHVREESVQWSDRQGVELRTGLELLEEKRSRVREELGFIPASLVGVKTYMDGKKEIVIRIVHQENILIEYMRVTQPWGSKFFFKDGVSITEHLYQLESDLEGLLASKVFTF